MSSNKGKFKMKKKGTSKKVENKCNKREMQSKRKRNTVRSSSLLRRRKIFKDSPRIVHFVPLTSKNVKNFKYPREKGEGYPPAIISPDAMKRINRRMHLFEKKKIKSRPHAPKNSTSDLIDQYNKRLENEEEEEEEVELSNQILDQSESEGSKINSCCDGIDTFGTFDLLRRKLNTLQF